MANEAKFKFLSSRALIAGGVFVIAAMTLGTALAIQDRNERRLMADLERTQSELLVLGDQITSLKDGGLKSMNDYLGTYAQIEPLQNKYDKKLQKFVAWCIERQIELVHIQPGKATAERACREFSRAVTG